MPISVTRAIEALIMPPGGLIILMLLGLLLAAVGRASGGRLLLFGGLASLWILSLPVVADQLLRSLERETRPFVTDNGAQAIVVLSGSRHGRTPEYGGDTVGASTLERVRYTAHLHRLTGLPVVASGGGPGGEAIAVAELMRRALIAGFGVQTVWTEERSGTTRENGRFSAQLLAERGIRRILLVTHAWHMPRARESFERAGLEVVPAPTLFTPVPNTTSSYAWLPDADALRRTRWALHEWLGRIYYRLLD